MVTFIISFTILSYICIFDGYFLFSEKQIIKNGSSKVLLIYK